MRDLNALVGRTKTRLPPASWVKPDSQHLTFAFLGEQDESLIDRIAPALEQRLAGIVKFNACLRACGFFPNPRRARVGWIGLHPEEPFVEIAHVVRDVVQHNGVELDGAEFKPHLTLMRLRDYWPPASIALFEKTFDAVHSPSFVVDSLTLYSSRLNPNGAIHTPLRRFALA